MKMRMRKNKSGNSSVSSSTTSMSTKNAIGVLVVILFVTAIFFNYKATSTIELTNKKANFDTSVFVLTNLTENITLDYESCTNSMVVPENWCLDEDKVPRYVGNEEWPPRKVQHYTHDGYEQCLADKTVVFIGDSRVRYQFLHLANYLKSKERMRCQDYTLDNSSLPITPDPECFVINESQRNIDWITWYKESTIALESNKQSGLCDCYRPPRFNPIGTYENRFIKRSTPFGEINLIYLQNYMNLIRMDEEFPPYSSFASTPKRCKTGECNTVNRTDAFQGNLNETLWNILPQLNATHAFVNLGWEKNFPFAKQSDFSCTMREFERHHPDIKLYLISHPPKTQHIDNPLANFDVKKLKCDSNVLDRTNTNKNIPSNWYWDTQHALSILNEEYNHQLVEKICPIKK